MAGGNHRSQIELRPTVAGLAVGRERVVMLEQTTDAAEVDHEVRVRRAWAHAMSRGISNSGPRVGDFNSRRGVTQTGESEILT